MGDMTYSRKHLRTNFFESAWSSEIVSHVGLCVFQLESTYNVAARDMARSGIHLEWNKIINIDQIEQSIAEIKVFYAYIL